MKKFLVLTAVLMALISAQAKTLLNNIDLKWMPTTEFTVFDKLNYKYLLKSKIKFEKLTDARDVVDLKLIGENIEDSPKILPVTTKTEIADFYTNNFSDIFKKLGFEVSDSDAVYTVGGKITNLFVKEDNTYNGNLICKLFLKKSGKIIWEGVINAENKKFGRSYSLDNYLEMYSDLAIETMFSLLSNEKFKQSFGIQAPVVVADKNKTIKKMAENFIDLKWKPTTELKIFEKTEYKDLINSKIKIEKFTDARDPITEFIGENIENASQSKPVMTNSDLGLYYKDGFSDMLKKLGFEITSVNPEFTLGGKITHLFLTEKNTYVGSLIMKLQLKKGNSIVWEDVINVEKSRFGKSFKMENYIEVYSDLGVEALVTLLGNEKFKTTMRRNTHKK